MVQEFVATIPFSDIPGIITGEKANPEYFVPKLAEFIPRFFQRKGIDTIASSLGINSTGWLYSTLRNMLETDLGKQNLNKFLNSLFNVDSGHSMGSSIISKLDPQDKEKMADVIQTKTTNSETQIVNRLYSIANIGRTIVVSYCRPQIYPNIFTVNRKGMSVTSGMSCSAVSFNINVQVC